MRIAQTPSRSAEFHSAVSRISNPQGVSCSRTLSTFHALQNEIPRYSRVELCVTRQSDPHRKYQRGLTLIEILVSSALLLVITLGLTAMFNQTQRAFRMGMESVDVYEGTRAATEMMGRD